MERDRALAIPPISRCFGPTVPTSVHSMKKKRTFILYVLAAVALCAIGLTTPATADEGPNPAPSARPVVAPALPKTSAPLDAFIEAATAIVTTQKSTSEGPAAPAAATPAPAAPVSAPARAVPIARSYPRGFSTYDGLVEYATSVAATQKAADDRLAATMAHVDASRAALATVFDPRVRGGLLQSRAAVIDDGTVRALETDLANDLVAERQLVADGAHVAAPAAWQLPLHGEDSQDFGPTPYWFEPSLTYDGVYYPHFHTGTDIATAWGTPIVAPAAGVVVFAGMMGDGAEVVVLAHDSGLVSMYAHLDNQIFPVPVKAGDTVQAGDRIGNVGLTGITTGAHLHWSVWRNGNLVDPLSMIRSQ